eukprot:scaffold3117_cov208-Skeletonema_menzelii.AAC.5
MPSRTKQLAIYGIFASLAEPSAGYDGARRCRSTCFIANVNRIHQHSTILSSTSSSNSGVNKRADKNQKKSNNTQLNNKRMRKSDINELVRGIGLQPVQVKSKANKGIDQSNEEPQTPQAKDIEVFAGMNNRGAPTISLQKQLDYSRSGHTVLRSFISQQTIEQLKAEIVPYAKSQALAAWKQKKVPTPENGGTGLLFVNYSHSD